MFLKFTLRNIVDFQHCVNLGCIAKSFSYTNICIYILFNKPNLLTLVVVKESTVFIAECQAGEEATLLTRPQLSAGFPFHCQRLSGKDS